MKFGKILLIILFATALLAGCKNIEDDIIGTWNFQTFDNQPQGTYTWTFKEGGQLIRVSTANEDVVFDTCTYTVDKSIFKKRITIEGSSEIFGQTTLNGVYRIDKFKEDVLILTRERLSDDSPDGAYLRCEMIRKQ